MPDDNVLVKQISQYPRGTPVLADYFIFQQGGINGPYMSAATSDILGAFELGGFLRIAPYPDGGIAFNGATITFANGAFTFSENIIADNIQAQGGLFQNGEKVATELWAASLFDVITENVVFSFNGRRGDIMLTTDDVRKAGAVPNVNPAFFGTVTAPTPWDYSSATDQVATTAFVQCAIQSQVQRGCIVGSFNGRGGDVWLTADDVSLALTQPGVYGYCNAPPLGDASKRIVNSAFVDESMIGLQDKIESDLSDIAAQLDAAFAPLDSPQFTGIPTAPTAPPGTTTGQLATTAYVQAAVTASTTGVSSFNTRTGAVVLTTGDVTSAGGAPLASPAFTGNPTATTQAPGDNSTRLATTAFVHAAIAAVAAGVTSFNTRTGAVTLQLSDVTAVGGAPLASPAFSGTPTAPTATPTTNTTQIATTAFVANALAALPAPVSSFNGRTGAVTFQASDISAVGGALLASPIFTGTPTGPTATSGTSNQQLATTAFVQAAVTAAVSGVTSFNGRSGVVTLSSSDVTGVGGALLASPAFTGAPSAPTATAGTNSTQVATTAFVQTALAAAPGGVSSFNSRTGAITLLGADVSAAGGALIASPTFTGTPAAPTPAPGTSTTQLATTAFVQNALATAGGVSSWNGRAGAVTYTTADIVVPAGGHTLSVSATAPTGGLSVDNQSFWWDSVHGQLYLRYFDGTSRQWVMANAPAPPTPTYQAWSYITAGAATFTTPANASTSTIYKFRMVGGGGGGGAASSSSTLTGGGGNGASYCEGTFTGIAASTAVALVVGAAGIGQAAASALQGGAGGASTITLPASAGIATAPGGLGGVGNSGGAFVPSSGPGAQPNGSVTGSVSLTLGVPGMFPGTTAANNLYRVDGGDSVLGFGARVNFFAVTPIASGQAGYGGGGGGSWNPTQASTAGTVGCIVIERVAG